MGGSEARMRQHRVNWASVYKGTRSSSFGPVSARLAKSIPEDAARRVGMITSLAKGEIHRVDLRPADGKFIADNGHRACWNPSQLTLLIEACNKYKVNIVSHFTDESWNHAEYENLKELERRWNITSVMCDEESHCGEDMSSEI